MDEIIVPSHQETWKQMFTHFPKNNVGAYHFLNSFFGHTDTRVKSTQGDYCRYVESDMQFLNNPKRSKKFFPAYRRTKAIVNPTVVTKVGIHFARDYAPGFSDYVVPVEIAYLHHYNAKNFDPGESVHDGTLLKHKEKLLSAVFHRLQCYNKDNYL